MAYHIPVPAFVRMTLYGVNFGAFKIYPEAKRGADGLEIIGWTVKDKDDVDRNLFDLLAQSVLPRALTNKVCELTFDNEDKPFVPVMFHLGDESWMFPMRAVEKEWETVHYEIEIEGEWMELIETYVGDLIPEDMLIFAEGEVRPNVDFGSDQEVFNQMV